MLIIIDTDAVRQHYPSPSQHHHHPTPIAHSFAHMALAGTRLISAPEGEELEVTALLGETVRVFATSGSDNFGDAVLLYGAPRRHGDQVLNDFHYKYFKSPTVAPQSANSPLPVKVVDKDFWFYQADVITAGAAGYEVWFALYIRDPNTGNPVLFGYFKWNLRLFVNG